MKTLALMMLATVFAILAIVSWTEHRAEQRTLPLVNTAGVQAPQLFAPCPMQHQNFTPPKERRA